MMSSPRSYAILMIQVVLAGLTLHTGRAGGEPNQQTLDRLPLSLQSVTGSTPPRLPSSTQWRGREYDIEAGIGILMGVVRAPEMSSKDREMALLQLAMLRTHLNGRPCLDELRERFDDAGGLEKTITLTCFKGARDPRAIPLFVRTLDNEQSMKLRLSAASGLAGWNIRRGVAELVELVESEEKLEQPARMAYVRDSALESFRNANSRKGWGFPINEWWKSIDGRPDLDEDQKRALYNEEIEREIRGIKKWFAENEHRFPAWKVGDPLPTNNEGDKDD